MTSEQEWKLNSLEEAVKEVFPFMEWMKDISSVIGSVHTEDIKEWLKKWEHLK